MSRENVEIVRRAWEAWGRGDLAATTELLDPEIEWDMSHFEGWPEHLLYRGLDRVRDFFAEWLGAWDDYEAGLDDALPAGERTVVALCWQRGRGHRSGIEANQSWAQVLTVENGRIVHCMNYTSRGEALREAGLGS